MKPNEEQANIKEGKPNKDHMTYTTAPGQKAGLSSVSGSVPLTVERAQLPALPYQKAGDTVWVDVTPAVNPTDQWLRQTVKPRRGGAHGWSDDEIFASEHKFSFSKQESLNTHIMRLIHVCSLRPLRTLQTRTDMRKLEAPSASKPDRSQRRSRSSETTCVLGDRRQCGLSYNYVTVKSVVHKSPEISVNTAALRLYTGLLRAEE
ncbi:hypothetical protein EYF80_008810 [Liparis tanakae]|uniref:Uncharacterized protein n=1 Tax=Liparis tanakae TaxID=230148 RepID=A0A4Z2ISE0_9TELE|nr:hypothetical protein EYF80_008810 [Liparis tanakae]